ncbi:hypothetical protein BDQ17DRAFT_1230821 [Cyathus striatus]|nr:hypothetical protein BDQ17DRAFT_1230821 [Cyathus striatus]
MYSNHRLDTPPPPPQFRRPWSPDPYEPLPSISTTRYNLASSAELSRQYQLHDEHDYSSFSHVPHARREASDISVEDLDLADYARRLRSQENEDPYPSFPSSRHEPFPFHCRDSLQLPSLVSRGPTLSSHAHSTPITSPRQESYSLPPTAYHSTQARSPAHSVDPYIVSPSTANSEVDVSQFPPWSRGWFSSRSPLAYDLDLDFPLPPSHLPTAKPKHKSIFDPSYVHSSYPDLPSSNGGDFDSSHEFVPWGTDLEQSSSPKLDPETKEERLRMLQREFGDIGKPKESDDPFLDENGRPLVGTVDKNGTLVTQGTKKRTAVRMLQILLAGGACVPAIYAALLIKPNEPPPPANKPPAFVLYVTSTLTFLLLCYMFFIRPCCCRKRRHTPYNPLGNGMMVLPVPNAGKQGNKKNAKKDKKGKHQGAVQVNLIVDPQAFAPPREEASSDDEDGWVPGGYDPHSKTKPRRKRKRRGIFEGLAMEEEWKRARGWARKVAVVDVVGMVLWGAVFVYILIGKRCPAGGFEGGECNAYNVSSACACLLCVAFGVSVFFDVKDLHTSKVSPRTRM